VATPEQTAGIITGCSVSIEGELVTGPKVKELRAGKIDLLGGSSGAYPLAKKAHSLEHLRDYPQFRARTKTIAASMRIRSAASLLIHQFFASRGFVNIHTPILTGNDCEGAGELFRVTPEGFFGKPAYLTVSGQLQAEIFASALGRVYTFGPTFRAENSHTQRHLAEFWMIEPEAAGFDLQETCSLAQDLVTTVTKDLLLSSPTDLDTLNPSNRTRLEAFLAKPFAYMTYAEALKVIPNPNEGVGLATEQERFLTVRCR
jgi:asparaginyl-tRNA synthetase